MAGIKSFRKLLNQVKLAWVSLILNIKSFFLGKTHTPSGNSSSEQNASDTKEINTIGSRLETKNSVGSEDEQDVWYDALEEQEQGEKERDLDEEEYFDVAEDFGEQEVSANRERKEYEKNKYYSLQDSLQEKTEFHRTTHTFTLAFEIERPLPDSDLSKFKLCKLKQNGDKYTFTLEDNQKNRIELHSKYLNMYFPKYFEKHSKKGAYTELFSPEENRINNDIIIPLRVPKEVSILTEEFGWRNFIKAKIQSQIPDFPMDVYLKDCKDHVNFHLNLNNTVSLSMTSVQTRFAAKLSGTPTETNWPIKDVLIRGGFVNTINKHAYKQPEAFEVVDVENNLKVKSRIGNVQKSVSTRIFSSTQFSVYQERKHQVER